MFRQPSGRPRTGAPQVTGALNKHQAAVAADSPITTSGPTAWLIQAAIRRAPVRTPHHFPKPPNRFALDLPIRQIVSPPCAVHQVTQGAHLGQVKLLPLKTIVQLSVGVSRIGRVTARCWCRPDVLLRRQTRRVVLELMPDATTVPDDPSVCVVPVPYALSRCSRPRRVR